MSTKKEKLQVAALVVVFPLLMACAYAIHWYTQLYVPKRKRLADLERAEMEAGCDGREKPWQS